MINKKTGKVYYENKKTRKSQWSKRTGDIWYFMWIMTLVNDLIYIYIYYKYI
jgi:hypothetical protein